MAERSNETLEQQRKARQEFLELKKMQSGEMETGPKPSEVAIVPKTPAEKLKNIWFHDKWFILGGIALAVVLAVLITQCATRTKYDLEVVVFSYQAVLDENIAPAADYLAKYCEDINGDGEVHIQFINCSFAKGSNTQYQYTMSTRLQAVLAADANALLFITDAESYKYLSGLSEEVSMFEGEPVPLDEKFYEACKGDEKTLGKLPEGLQISCRAIGETSIAKNKKIKDYYAQSQNILKGLRGEN